MFEIKKCFLIQEATTTAGILAPNFWKMKPTSWGQKSCRSDDSRSGGCKSQPGNFYADDLEPFEGRQDEVIQPPDFQIFLAKIIKKIFIGKNRWTREKRF